MMAQIAVHLPDAVEKKARKAAEAQGKTLSKWVAQEVERTLNERPPQALLDAPDFPDLHEIRKGYGAMVRANG